MRSPRLIFDFSSLYSEGYTVRVPGDSDYTVVFYTTQGFFRNSFFIFMFTRNFSVCDDFVFRTETRYGELGAPAFSGPAYNNF